MLDAAIRNLRELEVVGLTEKFHESAALLHHVYRWRLLAIPSRRVRTHRRPAVEELSMEGRAGLRRLNALDEALYEEGARHLNAAIARIGAAIARDAEALRLARQAEIASAAIAASDDNEIARRAAEILADTAAALVADLPERAHGLAMALIPYTAEIRDNVGGRLQRIAQLTREVTGLVRKQQARM
jgi:hypothetical protein